MNISINAEHYRIGRKREERSLREAIGYCRRGGFSHIDINALGEVDMDGLCGYIKELGMTVNQSHAPYNRYKQIDYAEFKKALSDGIKRADALASKIYVVHGDEFDFGSMEYTEERALEFNYSLYAPLADYAAAHDMKLAFEILFSDWDRPRYCSNVEQLLTLTEKFPESVAGVCWDFGHGKLAYKEGGWDDAILKVGDRLISTHVQDNFGAHDNHCYPFCGNLDWERAMQVLFEVRYKGDLTFEFVYDRFPDAILEEQLRMLYHLGEYLASLVG